MPYLEQVFLCEGLPNEGLDNFRAEVQAAVVQPSGLGTETHVVKGLASSQEGLAAVRQQALLDVQALRAEKVQHLQRVLQETDYRQPQHPRLTLLLT